MKTMGVLGGIGPQATMDFEMRLHRAAQRLIPGWANSSYPPMVVYYLRHAPFLLDADHKPLQPLQVDPRLYEAAEALGKLADFLVVTSNSPHVFAAEIEAAAGCKLLSMIDVTLAEVERRGWQRVGVLGMGRPVVYLEPLARLGLTGLTIGPELQGELDRAILALMAGQEGDAERSTARQAAADLRAEGVDGIILGCTELPLLLREHAQSDDLIDPAGLLAEAAVRFAVR